VDTLDPGDLHYQVRWSTRRKTLGLTVERDGSLTLAAPEACPMDRLRKFAESRRFWVYVQLARRDLLHRVYEPKSFVTGEGFSYLGRHYRLLLVEADEDAPLRLRDGRLQLHRDRAQDGPALLRRWYARLGQGWLSRRVQRLAAHAGVEPPPIQIQDLGYRWGSCGRNGRLYFNWRVMALPTPLVEYVVAHELVHLRESHHTQRFWRLLGRIMPDNGQFRERLARTGGCLHYLGLRELRNAVNHLHTGGLNPARSTIRSTAPTPHFSTGIIHGKGPLLAFFADLKVNTAEGSSYEETQLRPHQTPQAQGNGLSGQRQRLLYRGLQD
jgi:predicted metal-dependent hydrolase